ncbi:MAG: dihydroorotate dehydrogenase electron transfer subunit [Phycisphaerales bacterium]|nr:dihydroorotate dehydrogenase electron transfer subunit [Phycisphaerales bacterium]
MVPACHPVILVGSVHRNVGLCREHFRMTLRVKGFPDAAPGQFVHLVPTLEAPPHYHALDAPEDEVSWRLDADAGSRPWTGRDAVQQPMLRRAFSIAGMRDIHDAANLHAVPSSGHEREIDVIYRVVGAGTALMSRLGEGEKVSVLGPLGHPFPRPIGKSHAWLVAGGVGLPPMLWLAQALNECGRQGVAFCGARSVDLVPLTLTSPPPSRDARAATFSSAEFNAAGTPVVLATDDGSAGFAGHVGAALLAYHAAHPVAADQLVIYTCGPEVMMRFVAQFALERGIECHVCMERSMACGMGTCQSCVLPVRDASDPAGWRYSLCCTEGPVYEAGQLLWDVPAAR